MAGTIFIVRPDGALLELRQEGYVTEDALQALLADYPSLLAGDQLNESEPRRFVLVRREAGLAGEFGGGDRWSLDHLFLDQDAIPTIVEVKRSTDTRIRREVVGQMLDYAANAVVYLPVERLRGWYEEDKGEDPGADLALTLRAQIDYEAFWTQVRTNLQAGRVRLVFVADVVPAELSRIIEFLNVQMNPAEVVGVEVQQYVAGDGTRTLVPRIVGRTAGAQRAKGSGLRSSERWDEDRLAEALSAEQGVLARRLVAWGRDRGLRIESGKGQWPSLLWYLDDRGIVYSLFSISGDGWVWLSLGILKSRPVFEALGLRQRLVSQLRTLPGVSIPESREDKNPRIPLDALRASGIDTFEAAWDEAIEAVRTATDMATGSDEASDS